MKQNNLTKQNNFTSFPKRLKRLKRLKLIKQNNFTFPETVETNKTK
jgi:hypothetical protein